MTTEPTEREKFEAWYSKQHFTGFAANALDFAKQLAFYAWQARASKEVNIIILDGNYEHVCDTGYNVVKTIERSGNLTLQEILTQRMKK